MPETPTRFTPTQRVVLWILNALMFYVVVLYPVLLMAAFEPDDVVHYGFLRWMAVVLVLYWGALQLFFTERPAEPRVGRMLLAIFAVLLLLLGTFTPIVSFPFVGDVDFFRAGYADGYVLLILTALSLALAVTGRWKQVLVPALGSLAVVLWTFLGVQDTVADARSGSAAALAGNPHEGLAASVIQSIQWEWGWLLLFAGSGLLVYSAARKDRPEPEYPPLVSVTAEDEYGSAGEAPDAADAAQASAPAAGESATSGPAAAVTAEEEAVTAEASEADSVPAEQAEAPEAQAAAAPEPAEASAEQATAPVEPATAASSAETEAGAAETAATAKPETGATGPAETAAGAIGAAAETSARASGAAAETSARASGEAAPTAGVDEPGTDTAAPTDESAGADETVAEASRPATASTDVSARQPEAAAAEPAAQEVESTTAGAGAPPKPAPADAGAAEESRAASTQAEATAEPGNATDGAVTAEQTRQAAASGPRPTASGAKKE